MSKQVVHYHETVDDKIREGHSAWLFDVLDHPSDSVSNTKGQLVVTSPVIRLNANGFETQNSIYIRC